MQNPVVEDEGELTDSWWDIWAFLADTSHHRCLIKLGPDQAPQARLSLWWKSAFTKFKPPFSL